MNLEKKKEFSQRWLVILLDKKDSLKEKNSMTFLNICCKVDSSHLSKNTKKEAVH